MIKVCCMGWASAAPSQTEADRYYFRYHGPEAVYWGGPWQVRYWTWKPRTTPQEAIERFGAQPIGFYTEIWHYRAEDAVETGQMPRPYTPQPWEGKPAPDYARFTIAAVPALPTEDFLGAEPNPEEGPILRWISAFDYPEGVSLEDGEKWFLEVHSQEAKTQPGLLRYISHLSVDWLRERWPCTRISEMWYRNIDDWRKAVIESPPNYTLPPWGGEYPFVDMVSNFVDLKPDVDFLRGNYIIP